MKRIPVLAVALVALCGGCDKNGKPITWTPPWSTAEPSTQPAGAPTAEAALPTPSPVQPATARHVAEAVQPTRAPGEGHRGRKYAILVQFRVITIEVPLGTISSSEKLWSYLDEELLGEDSLVNLGRNGFRVGAGVQATWSDVDKILKELTRRPLKATTLMAEPGKGVPFVVKEKQGEQMIFTFYEDRTCSGETYPPGDNLLTMACTYDPDDPRKIVLSGVPLIRTTNRRMRYVKEPSRIRAVVKPTLYPFDTLGFQMEMRGGDFLVIGPGVQAARENSIGHHFLIQRRKGVQWERVLILRPEVVATEVRRSPGPGALSPPPADKGPDEDE